MNQKMERRNMKQLDLKPEKEQNFNVFSLRSKSIPLENQNNVYFQFDEQQQYIVLTEQFESGRNQFEEMENETENQNDQLLQMSKIVQQLMEEIELLKNEQMQQVSSDKMEKILQENLGLKIQLQTSQSQLKITLESMAETQNEVNELKKQQQDKQNDNLKLAEQVVLLQKAINETQNIIEKYEEQLKEINFVSQKEIQYLKNQLEETKSNQYAEVQRLKECYEKQLNSMDQKLQKNLSFTENQQNLYKVKEQVQIESEKKYKQVVENLNRQLQQVTLENTEYSRQVQILEQQIDGLRRRYVELQHPNRTAHSLSPISIKSRALSRRIFEDKENFNHSLTENNQILSNQINLSRVSMKQNNQQNILEKPVSKISQVSLKSNPQQSSNIICFEKSQKINVSPQGHIVQPLQKLMAFRLRIP